jgi:hypothetical protein
MLSINILHSLVKTLAFHVTQLTLIKVLQATNLLFDEVMDIDKVCYEKVIVSCDVQSGLLSIGSV